MTACSFLFLAVNVGFPSTGFGIYQSFIVALPNMSHADASIITSVRALVSLLAMFVTAFYYRRLDCRVGVAVGTFLTAAGFFAYSRATALPVYVVGSVFAGAGYGLGGMVGMTLLAGRWYKQRTATAVGIATAGSGFAGIVIPLVAQRIIVTCSLSASFAFQAYVAAAVGVLMAVLLRNKPVDIGAVAYGEGGGAQASEKAAPRCKAAKADLRGASFFVFMAGMVMVGACCVGGVQFLGILFTNEGFSTLFASLMLSISGIALTCAKFVVGEIFDHMGTFKGTLVFSGILFAGLALCALAPFGVKALAVAGSALFAIGASLGTVGISMWSLELSTQQGRAKMIKNCQVGYAGGGFLFNLFPGFIAEACGTYAVSYAALAVLAVAAAVIVLGTYRRAASRR